jgi:thiamine-phosphate pyrophosphorylase
MPADTTPAVARAVEAARLAAAADGVMAVAPRHLLAGLLAETEGHAAAWLAEHGLDLTRIQVAPSAHPSGGPAPALPYADAAGRALDEAGRLARSSTADHVVTSEHLLLGLLRADADLREELHRQGLQFNTLEASYTGKHVSPLSLDAPLEFGDVTERADAARILDASANRAREALRVLEDFVRFSLGDASLSRQVKQIRHDLTGALVELSPQELVASRDTLGDVGTDISTGREQVRFSLADVVRANLKRLQEALRSLEEYGKLRSAMFGERIQNIRYRTYTLERALVLGAESRRQLEHARLYVLVTGATCRAALDWTIAEAAAGGADVIQLREKSLPDRELLRRASDVRRWTRKAGVLFIMNDRPDVARLAEADGVHLGQDDLSVGEARRIVGSDALVGVSTRTLDQVRRAVLDGASYIGVGPTFPSTTKAFDELAGLEFVRAATAETTLPAFALGGVAVDNVGQVVAAGGRRVAVSVAIAQADDPRAAAAALRAALP